MTDENLSQQEQEKQLDVESLQKELDDAIARAEANLNGWKRAQADFENYRRRKETENKELLEFAKEVTVVKLLPTIDTLEQALRHMPREENSEAGSGKQEFYNKYRNWQQGVEGILKQLDKALEELGVRKIEAVGQRFDPLKHEALRQVDGEEDGVVVDEMQTGFELNGKVIRPSQVVISKKK